jgi:hypothetical protein
MAKKKPHFPDNPTLTLGVAYGDVSIGDKTARISIKVDRDTLSIIQADKNLCDKRLTGSIVRRPKGESNGQGRLDGMEDYGIETLKGIFDVKGFSVTKKHVAFGLTFAIASVDIGQLASFAKRSGELVINSSESIPDEDDMEEDKT